MSSPAPTSPPSPPSNSASPLSAPVVTSPPAPAVASPPAPAVASSPAPAVTSPPAPATASSPPAPPPATNPPPVAKSPSPSSSPPPPSTPAPATSPPPPRNSSTPVTPSPPPPSGSKSPSTPAVTPSTPSGTTPSTPGIPPPPTSTSPSTPSSSNNGGTNGISTGMIAGIAIAGVAAILLLVVLLMCCKKKKRRQNAPAEYYGPPPSHQKVEPYGGPAYHWQQSAPPQIDHVVTIPPKVPLPPGEGGGARPPHSPASHPPPPPALPAHVSSGGSGSNYSGSETPAIPPSPGMVFAFSQSTFTYEELSIATDGFSEANLLGQGGFGYVHKGILPNGKEVAIKQLKTGSGQGEREFQAEVEIISRVHHKHLVSLVGYCMAGAQRMLVYEFVPNDTLEFHLHGTGRPSLDWSMRLRIALGAAKGLAYLHEDCHPKIIHRDIKASNILLDFNFEAKVADFGLAKLSSDANTHISTRVMGTFGYLAPEYASSGKLTDRSDVFSFGVVLLELLTGRRPVDTKQSYMDDSLVDWARPLLTRALEEGNFNGLLDEKLQNDYTQTEVSRMVACAAASVRHSARRRPKMSQIVRALEGQVSLSDLNEGIMPGHSTVYSSDYDTAQYKEDMIKFRNLALASKDYTSSEYSAPTSEYGLNPSGSSSEAQTTSEMEMSGKMKKDSKGFNGGSS